MNTTTQTLAVIANDPKLYTVEDLKTIMQEAKASAAIAAQSFLDDRNASTGGNQYGEPMYCGFAWVTIHPEHKGNTRLGKLERRVIEAMGFKKDWTGKAYQLWNCTGYAGQSMDVKEAGAQAYAEVLRSAGFKAYMGSRAD